MYLKIFISANKIILKLLNTQTYHSVTVNKWEANHIQPMFNSQISYMKYSHKDEDGSDWFRRSRSAVRGRDAFVYKTVG